MEGQVTPETNLQQLLTNFPNLIPLFIQERLACVGCVMARFETLDELSRNYNLDLTQFIADIETILAQAPQ
jgi:hybrid cluster-associated redox disulfide protein